MSKSTSSIIIVFVFVDKLSFADPAQRSLRHLYQCIRFHQCMYQVHSRICCSQYCETPAKTNACVNSGTVVSIAGPTHSSSWGPSLTTLWTSSLKCFSHRYHRNLSALSNFWGSAESCPTSLRPNTLIYRIIKGYQTRQWCAAKAIFRFSLLLIHDKKKFTASVVLFLALKSNCRSERRPSVSRNATNFTYMQFAQSFDHRLIGPYGPVFVKSLYLVLYYNNPRFLPLYRQSP